MKRIWFITIVLGCLCAGNAAAQSNSVAQELVMMTYNIKGGDLLNSRQLKSLTTVINSVKPDVVAVQEVNNRFFKCDVELGTQTGMKSRFLVTNKTNYGIVLLSKEEPLSIINHLIPKGAGGGTAKPDPDENRGIIIAEFENYYFASTHYSLNAEDRDVATDYIVKFAKSANKAVFVGGDLNVQETYRAMVTFKSNGFKILNNTNTLTFPADNPVNCIDYILGYNRAPTALEYEVTETGIARDHDIDLTKVTDHLPVYVKVNLFPKHTSSVEMNTIESLFEGGAEVNIYSPTGVLVMRKIISDGEELILPPSFSSVILQIKNSRGVYVRKVYI